MLSVAAGVLVAGAVVVASAGAASGDLTFAGCIGELAGCTATSPTAALDGAAHVAVTADGRQLYATAAGTVSHFAIDAAGNVSFNGCIGRRVGCVATNPTNALDGADGVAVTADGKRLYAASPDANAVSHFVIDAAGNPTLEGCTANEPGCAP